jgi:hypothetical protein
MFSQTDVENAIADAKRELLIMVWLMALFYQWDAICISVDGCVME